MKIIIYELLGMVKDGKASDVTTNFMFDRKKYNLLGFLDEYTLDINSLNWEIEILEEEKKIPEKLEEFDIQGLEVSGYSMTQAEYLLEDGVKENRKMINWILDYLKNKGDE